MSLQVLAEAFRVDTDADAKLVLILLANVADENYIAVPFLPRLAADAGMDLDTLRSVLDRLTTAGVIAPASDYPFDFFASTEGFRLQLNVLDKVEYVESPWSKNLRSTVQ